MNAAKRKMLLKDFQSSTGIPEEKQICLPVEQVFDSKWSNLIVESPKKSEFKVGELRKWLNILYRFIWEYKLSKISILKGKYIYISDGYGRIERRELLERVITILKDKLSEHIVILGKSDIELDEKIAYLAQNFNFLLFGNNVNIKHPNLGYLPMGRDWRGKKYHYLQPSADKDCLVYCNFSTNTHPLREITYERLKFKKFIKFDHMGKFLNYPIGHSEFYRRLRQAKFCIAPRGNAIETFRMWDCLYLGTIPIVVKEAVFHDELKDLPILFIDSYQAYSDLTEKKLNQIYNEMCLREWSYQKLTNCFWIDLISKIKMPTLT
jgi:hypothetical protein